MQTAKDQSGNLLKLSGTLDIAAAQELRRELQDFVVSAQRPTVELSTVDACDATGLQLLCAARKTAAAAGKSFEIAAIPQAIREVCSELGVSLAELTTASVEGETREL